MQDLEIIFSRFGNITSCDIIKDWKTGDSLCYAFLGFDSDEACEEAYFKMNNCLIDDRRIKAGHHLTITQRLCKYQQDRGACGPRPLMLQPCQIHCFCTFITRGANRRQQPQFLPNILARSL